MRWFPLSQAISSRSFDKCTSLLKHKLSCMDQLSLLFVCSKAKMNYFGYCMILNISAMSLELLDFQSTRLIITESPTMPLSLTLGNKLISLSSSNHEVLSFDLSSSAEPLLSADHHCQPFATTYLNFHALIYHRRQASHLS